MAVSGDGIQERAISIQGGRASEGIAALAVLFESSSSSGEERLRNVSLAPWARRPGNKGALPDCSGLAG